MSEEREELIDRARAEEAERLCHNGEYTVFTHVGKTAARLAREGWVPAGFLAHQETSGWRPSQTDIAREIWCAMRDTIPDVSRLPAQCDKAANAILALPTTSQETT